MTNNKKVSFFLILIVVFFTILFLFPSINSKIRNQFFYTKSLIWSPINYFTNEFINFTEMLTFNKENFIKTKMLENKVQNLEEINKMLMLSLSKFHELNYLLFEEMDEVPKSIGVKNIGNKNHLIEDIFVVDKGFESGLSSGDYVINDNSVIGRIRTVNYNSAEVVSVLNIDYGDEVIIKKKSLIVNGSNKSYLNFIRQKNSTEELNLNIGDIVKIKVNNHYIKLGTVGLLKEKFIIVPKLTTSYSTARVIISD